jgi:hypothetical protein
MGFELVISEQPGTLAPSEAGSSLVGWFLAYCHAEVAGAPKPTLQAKKRDFELFLGYFANGNERVSGAHPERVSGAHLGLENGRPGQER